MSEEEFEAIMSLQEWSWTRVRELMRNDIYHNIREFCKFESAMESTHRFLVDVCGLTCEAAAIPADIYKVYADIIGEDLEFEEE